MERCPLSRKFSEVEKMGKKQSQDSRNDRKTRKIRQSGYLVVTDTEKTERLYFEGLKTSVEQDRADNLLLKIYSKKDTNKMIDFALSERNKEPRFREIWLVFDKDEIPNFNELIDTAKANDINVGWSNPCFEVWMSGYFASPIMEISSKKCCEKFETLFTKKTGLKEYNKSEKDIYHLLNKYGNERKAVKSAKQRYLYLSTEKWSTDSVEKWSTM